MEIATVQNLSLRIIAFVLLLISTIVMLTSKTSDSFILSSGEITTFQYRFKDYKPFRYVVAANVLGCAYSFLRIVQGLIGVSGGFNFHLSFIFDQVLAYIIFSSASAGIACIMLTKELLQQSEILYDAASKKFLRYASASVSTELMGFVAIATCAVMSAYSLSCYLYSSTINTVPTQGFPPPITDTKQQSGVA